jgi:transcriptional regulator with XRE-family HTH domain
MSNQVWLPEDAALLKELREAAQIDTSTLAMYYSLSKKQVKQLEEGGDSSFYSPAIKLATGRKLLMHFGVDDLPVSKTDNQNQTPKIKIPLVNLLEEVENKKTKSYLRLQIIAAVLTLLGFAALNAYFSDMNTLSLLEGLLNKSSLTMQIDAATLEGIANETPAITSKETTVKTISVHLEKCKWGSEPVSIMGHQPYKSGDYVYIVANIDADICIRDFTGKSQILQLKSEQSQTVRGHPPFEIFSNSLSEFKIFYQGNLLRLPRNGVVNITLKEQRYE